MKTNISEKTDTVKTKKILAMLSLLDKMTQESNELQRINQSTDIISLLMDTKAITPEEVQMFLDVKHGLEVGELL